MIRIRLRPVLLLTLLMVCLMTASLPAQENPLADSLQNELARHPEHDTVRFKILLALADALEREKPGQSVSYALDAQELAVELNMPLLQADAIQQTGNSYGILGANMKQRDCYVTARKIYQDQGNRRGEVAVLNNLGTVSLAEKNFEIARQYLTKALQMTLAAKEERHLPAIFNNLGNMFEGMAEYDSALTYYNHAYDQVRENSPDAVVESIILLNIGNTYAEMGEMDRALKIYYECLTNKQEINDLYGLCEVYLNIGDSYLELGKLDSALFYLQNGQAVAEEISAVEMQELVHRQMAILYDSLGRSDLALEHSSKSIALLDSLRKDEAISASEATQMRIQAEQTIHERELASAKAAIEQQDKLRQQRIVSIAAVICLALILLLSFFIYQRYRERRDAASLLEARVQERTNELSQSNQRLEQALKELEVSNRNLNTFIYRSSHDLRSPLTSISGLLDILKTSVDEHEAQRFVALAEEKTNHLNRLLEQLIESVDLLARSPQAAAIPVHELWQEIVDGLQKKVGYEALRLELAAAPGLQVHSDRACLRVILTCLLMNAIDFRKTGMLEKAWCKVTVLPSASGSTIMVEDNGVGMSSQVQARAFEMFYRGTLQAKGTGNGLGLYTAKKMAEMIGADIQIRSDEGKGSTITLQVPKMA